MTSQAKPTVPDVLPLVRRLYSEEDPCTRVNGCVGGHLHVVLDDGNVSDVHVKWCLDEAKADGCATCTELAEAMLRMSRTQRARLSALR